jgi:hypothetical protein
MEATAPTAEERRDALVGKLFAGTIEALDLLGVYIGDQLGLYRALAERGALTPPELANRRALCTRVARAPSGERHPRSGDGFRHGGRAPVQPSCRS